MKKRVKPSWKSLTKGEKIGVLMFYVITLGIFAQFIGIMYIRCPLFW